MKRDIKFRAWNGSKMIIPACIDELGRWYETGRHYEDGRSDEDGLMLFTGLHDKNGKEIYEGDILRYESSNDPVNFSCFEVFFHDGDANTDYNIGYSINRIYYHGNICGGVVPSFKPKTTKYMIVIGNIYENPELLDQP